VETTVLIRIDLLNRIAKAAQSRGISRSRLIIILLMKIMKEPPHTPRLGRLVEYQARRDGYDLHPFHISFKEDENEYFQDLRKLLKMSLSLILAFAVERYLNASKRDTLTDNNLFRNYFIIKELVDSIICWKIYWGHPPEIRQHC
jgi:hypothetical protein